MSSQPIQSNGLRRYIDIRETADYLGCTVNTLYSWVSQKRVPHVKLGRLVKFDRVDLDKWIDDNKVKVYGS